METSKKLEKRLCVNLRPACGDKLLQLKEELEKRQGIKLSSSGVVEYLINNHKLKDN